MIWPLFKKNLTQSQAESLFDAISGQARRPDFFLAGGVADTVEGRFEVLVFHMFLALKRLREGGPEETALSRKLQEIFFQSLDDALRELGVGDMRVAKKIRGLAEAFYGRVSAYDRALGAAPAAFHAAVARNMFRTENAPCADLFYQYAARSVRRLSAASTQALGAAFASLGGLSCGIRLEPVDG